VIGCLLLSAACSQDVGGARPGADPRPQAPEVREIAHQRIELEPGHHVTIRRLGNEMVVVTEVGDLDKHEPRIGDRAFLRSVEQIVHLADPQAAVDAGLTAPAAALAPGAPGADRPHTPALLAAAPVAPIVPKTSFVPVLQSTSGAGDNVTILRCHDPAVSTCFPQASGSATTAPAYGAWYRTFAVNRDPYGAVATFNASVAVGLDWSTVSSEPLGAGQWGELQVLSVTQDWIRSTVTSPDSTTPVGISSLVASVAPRAQERFNWCWASSAQMVMATLGVAREQCTIAGTHFGRDCCAANADPSCGTVGSSTQGEGEAWQALAENGFHFSFMSGAVNDTQALADALQGGPLIMYQPNHYTVLTDYREVFENGVWVPYALKIDPEPENDFSQDDHARWVKLSQVGANNGGYATDALADIFFAASRAPLEVTIPRVSWEAGGSFGLTTGYFDAPGAASYHWVWRDLGATVYGTGSSSAPPSAPGALSRASLVMGPWLWYRLDVQACNVAGTCGSWKTATDVTLAPSTVINELSWTANTLTARFTGDPHPVTYRYPASSMAATPQRSPGSPRRWRLRRAARTARPRSPST